MTMRRVRLALALLATAVFASRDDAPTEPPEPVEVPSIECGFALVFSERPGVADSVRVGKCEDPTWNGITLEARD